MRGVFLENLSWAEAKSWFDRGAPLIYPLGAAAKEHGLHLPLGTDALTAQALGRMIAEALPVVIAPNIGFGYFPAFTAYAGSQHLSAQTFIELVVELVGNAADHGVTRQAIVNNGVSTEAPLQIAARRLLETRGLRLHIADIRRLGRAADGLLDNPGGGHADERETSILLALAPERVRLEKARPEPAPARDSRGKPGIFLSPAKLDDDPANPDRSLTGATGDPTLASAEKGRAILAAIGRDLIQGLIAIFPDLEPSEPT